MYKKNVFSRPTFSQSISSFLYLLSENLRKRIDKMSVNWVKEKNRKKMSRKLAVIGSERQEQIRSSFMFFTHVGIVFFSQIAAMKKMRLDGRQKQMKQLLLEEKLSPSFQRCVLFIVKKTQTILHPVPSQKRMEPVF